VWLLNIILKSIQQQVISAATDKAIGLPVASIDGAFSYGSLIERACDGVDKLTTSETMFALLSVAVTDDKGLLIVSHVPVFLLLIHLLLHHLCLSRHWLGLAPDLLSCMAFIHHYILLES